VLRRLNSYIRRFATTLLTERLDPAPAAAAVFWGVLIGIVPIYGLQTLAAIGVALLFRLNKPLTLASTFVNNPLFQPFLVISSLELGGFMRNGSFRPWHMTALGGAQLKEQFLDLEENLFEFISVVEKISVLGREEFIFGEEGFVFTGKEEAFSFYFFV